MKPCCSADNRLKYAKADSTPSSLRSPKKATAHQADVRVSQPSCKDTEFHPTQYRYHKSISWSSMLEELPAWFNDLLSDSDSTSNGTLHRQSASDSLTLFTDLTILQDLDQLNGMETVDSCEPDRDWGPTCAYGPNSPRRKNKLCYPEKETVSLFSEYTMQYPLHHRDGYIPVSEVPQSDSSGDACASVGEINAGNIQMKCHPGQWSRAQKLQYIAELERTNLGSEVTVRVASLVQQHTALLMENDTLKQQLQRLQQKKFVIDEPVLSLTHEKRTPLIIYCMRETLKGCLDEYLSLKKGLEKLKTGLVVSSNEVQNRPRSTASLAHSDATCNMLDMGKLYLN